MTNPPNKGIYKTVKWLVEHAGHEGSVCLIWPFNLVRGYGLFKYHDEFYYAHRYMCALVNGPPPTHKHQARHSCGNGHKGCVHPKHLLWGTQSQNQLDRRKHGTQLNAWWGRKGKLKPDQVRRIRSLEGKMTHDEIAAMFDIGRRNVGAILSRKTWNHI